MATKKLKAHKLSDKPYRIDLRRSPMPAYYRIIFQGQIIYPSGGEKGERNGLRLIVNEKEALQHRSSALIIGNYTMGNPKRDDGFYLGGQWNENVDVAFMVDVTISNTIFNQIFLTGASTYRDATARLIGYSLHGFCSTTQALSSVALHLDKGMMEIQKAVVQTI